MRSTTVVLAVFCLAAAAFSLPAPPAKDALEPKDDLKTDSTYGLGYAAYPAYYGYGYPAYGYGYGLSYDYGYPRYYYGYGYPSYYLRR